MAILTLDFHLRQGGTRQVAVTVHINGGMAVLTQHPAVWILGPALDLVMQIVRNKQIILGMQFRLLLAFFIEGAAIGR